MARKQIAVACLLAGLLLGAGTAGFRIRSQRAFFDPQHLLSRFPAEDALALSVDVSDLRHAGLLAQSKMSQEPDYRQFVDGTGFDYRRDLDSVAASFSKSGSYFVARGRFRWQMLRDYAVRQGGSCYRDLCRVQGSRPERHISFLPLRSDAIALAVSTDDFAATRLTHPGTPITTPIPAAPLWISVPGAELRRQNSLPPGVHLILTALSSAERIVITLAPSGQKIEAHLEATCRSENDARLLANELRSATALLKDAAARDKNSGGDEVSALLAAGTFDQTGLRVSGKWPVRQSLLDTLASAI